ncbi:MAG: hypothetical protein OER04_07005 [Cyclobacteriaceae bacterium]|nr:hypothetical protein [Cyclobacteriaceae bacterium]
MERYTNTRNLILIFVVLLAFWSTIAIQAQDETVFIAVVGGTSFGEPADFGKGMVEEEGMLTVETKAGTSPPIYKMRYKGVPFYYIRMYGVQAKLPDQREGLHHIKTWLALNQLGVTHVLGGASSGGIRTDYDYDDLVVIDDFMEMEVNRPQNILTFAGIERPGIFANYAHPYSPSLRKLLIEEALKMQDSYSGRLYTSATFVQHNPERFETAAEVRAMRILGGDLTSENIATCTVYARQLGIRFAALCSIANPAVGVRPFSFKDMQASVQRIAAQAIPIVLEVIARIPSDEEAMGPEPISTGELFEGSYTNPDSESHRIADPKN